MKNKYIVAITGASGSIYGIKLVEQLLEQNYEVHLIISPNGKIVLKQEIDVDQDIVDDNLVIWLNHKFNSENLSIHKIDDWFTSAASGSNRFDGMVVCPCSMATLSNIANGNSNNLISRAADVMLKEQRKLALVPRETPVSAIHLENMLKLARLNVAIIPASPSFYTKPSRISDLVDFMVSRILDNLGIKNKLVPRWGKESKSF